MRKPLFLLLAASLAAATVGSCRAGAPAAKKTPAALPAPTAPAPSADQLRQRLVSAGFGVPGKPLAAEDFELQSLAGGKLALSSFRGSFVLLNFWATWCPPCRAEMPSLENLFQKLREQGFTVVAVDLQEDAKKVKAYVKDTRLTFPVLLDASGRIGAIYGAASIPTTWLIDRSGAIVARAVGSRQWDTPEMLQLFVDLMAVP